MPEIEKLEYTTELENDLVNKDSLLKEFDSVGVLEFQKEFQGIPPGSLEQGSIRAAEPNVDFQTIFVRVGQNIQKAIDILDGAGGGIIKLAAGTHTITTALTGISALQFIGENTSTTILDFNSTSINFTFAGTSVDTTGTITSITNDVDVVGSGTSWLSTLTTDHQIFIAQFWYKIASINSNTTLTLGESFGGGVSFPGAAYRAAVIIKDIEFEELTFKNSTATALDLSDVRNLVIEDCEFTSNNKGFTINTSSEIRIDNCLVLSSTDNGTEIVNSGFLDVEALSIIGSGGHGMLLSTCRSAPFAFGASDANTNDGINLTDCTDVFLQVEVFGNGGQGIEAVSGNTNIIMSECLVGDNTGDGIKLTATTDECKIVNSQIKDGGAFGINIAASTCDNNIISNNFFGNNTSGALSDSGTNTEVQGNLGITVHNQFSEQLRYSYLTC